MGSVRIRTDRTYEEVNSALAAEPEARRAAGPPWRVLGIATVALRYCSHVDAINMGAAPVYRRGDTVVTPALLAGNL